MSEKIFETEKQDIEYKAMLKGSQKVIDKITENEKLSEKQKQQQIAIINKYQEISEIRIKHATWTGYLSEVFENEKIAADLPLLIQAFLYDIYGDIAVADAKANPLMALGAIFSKRTDD